MDKVKAVDFVCCSACGVEYNRFGPGHKCNPETLKQIAQMEADAQKEADEKAAGRR